MRPKKYGGAPARGRAGAKGGTMSERELKIGDIAHLTGISEQDVRTLVRTYESLFSYRTIGPVRLYPEKTIAIIREILELSGKGLTSGEITEEISIGRRPGAPEKPADEVARTCVALPPGLVLDLPMMQDTLARQERRIARLTGELEQEQERRKEEVARLQEAVDRLQGNLDRQQEQLAVVAEWVAYFDQRMDEVTRPMLERFRQTFGR
ncbi:hypothetical protein DSECCO2_627440 [anaerobic digester metagenome]